MSSPTANEAAVREAVRSIIAPMPIDKIVGQPSNSTVNVLKQQLAKIAAAVKTTSWGGRHGHLALVLNDAEYQTVTNVPTLTTTRLVLPPIVPANLANNTTLTHRTRIMADHNLECQEFWKQESVDAIIVDKIVRGSHRCRVRRRTRRRLHRLGAQTTKTILEHLRTEWCVVTTLEKKQASAAFHVQWDLTSHITKFAGNLTSNRSSAETSAYPPGCHQGPVLRGRHVLVRHVRRQGNAGMGTQTLCRQSVGLRQNSLRHPVQEQGKVQCQTIARTGRYTNSLETALEHTQEHAAALTTTQDHRLKQLETQQQELLSQTTKFMALLTAQQSIPTPGTTTGGQQRTARRNTRSTTAKSPRYCNSCKKSNVYHEGDACFALEKNKDKRVLSGTWPRCTINIHNTATHMSPRTIKEGINNGSIPSAVSDTGATSTAGTLHDPFIHSKTRSTKIFMLPTGTTTAATIQAQLLLNVRPPANTVDIVPNLHQTLLSGSKFADADYTAVMRQTRSLWRIPLRPVTVNDNTDTLILDSKCGLQSTHPRYHVPTPTHIREHLQASLQCNTDHILNVYELPSIEQSIRYLHAAAGFPTKSTWLAAIRKGNYSTWPLITVKNVHKHFPQSEETQQGHMRNQRQGTRSTKQALPQAEPRTPLPQLHDIFIRTYDTHGTLYTDQTGKFPHLSSQGNRYQMILYHVDSNSIWAEPTKNKTEGELILARNRALQRMKACGIQPTRQVLDNEISAAYKLAITASGMTYQLVPPDDHRRNIAEKAIQTWKDHFIAVISGTDAKFPLHLWCQLLPQMERQLCLLRQSNAYPHISSHTHLYGHHDYNAHPFVPWAWKPLSTTNPTAANLLPNTAPRVFFKHKYITNPSVTPADAIIAAAANLSHLLTNNLQAHHNNKVNQSDLTRLQILTQPSPPPQHNATHYQQHSPHATRPSSPAAVSDYDSDSSDSDDESITIPHPVPRCLCNLQGCHHNKP
eukprot:CCRYP_001594-RA/>CCRYP_001594-RA protein AED:0.64 eAED:0.32 QI:0/0/0/0.6/1/1/5/0/975